MNYSIEQVVKLTGVSAFSLRNWEKRYSFLHPKRLNNGFRYYDESSVALLKRVNELIEEGRRIGDLAALVKRGESLPEPSVVTRREELDGATSAIFTALKDGDFQRAAIAWEKLRAWAPASKQVSWVMAPLFARAQSEYAAVTLRAVEYHVVLSFVRNQLLALIQVPQVDPHHVASPQEAAAEGHRRTAVFAVLESAETVRTEDRLRMQVIAAFRALKARERGKSVHLFAEVVSALEIRELLGRHPDLEAHLVADSKAQTSMPGAGRMVFWISPALSSLDELLEFEVSQGLTRSASPGAVFENLSSPPTLAS